MHGAAGRFARANRIAADRRRRRSRHARLPPDGPAGARGARGRRRPAVAAPPSEEPCTNRLSPPSRASRRHAACSGRAPAHALGRRRDRPARPLRRAVRRRPHRRPAARGRAQRHDDERDADHLQHRLDAPARPAATRPASPTSPPPAAAPSTAAARRPAARRRRRARRTRASARTTSRPASRSSSTPPTAHVAGLISVGAGGDATKPFVTNATGVATGLNADRVDGKDAEDIAKDAVAASAGAEAVRSGRPTAATAARRAAWRPTASTTPAGGGRVHRHVHRRPAAVRAAGHDHRRRPRADHRHARPSPPTRRPRRSTVRTFNAAGSATDRAFHLSANC